MKVDIAGVNWKGLAAVDPQALGVTCWFDAMPAGAPYAVTVTFTGRRLTVPDRSGPQDSFAATETVAAVVPGSGPIAVTTRVGGVSSGPWTVTASATPVPHEHIAAASGTTAYEPVLAARGPAVHIGAWPAFVGLGAIVALGVQSWLASRLGFPVARTLPVSVVAGVFGMAGAKLYWLAEQRMTQTSAGWPGTAGGLCIQGFLITAVTTAAIGTFGLGIPVGGFVDLTAPALLFGMAIGRLGCFFGGCCAGRPTASRWGVWSSDRRVAMRRIPTQLLESLLAAALGAVALAANLGSGSRPGGVIFVGSMAAYTLGRQLLLPLRDLPRRRPRVRIPFAAAMAALVVVDTLVGALNTGWR